MSRSTEFEAFMRRLRRGLFPDKLRTGRGKDYTCVGGPYDGERLHLHTPRTLLFALGDFRGYYVPHPTDETKILWKEIEND